jgi:hypothetical protein
MDLRLLDLDSPWRWRFLTGDSLTGDQEIRRNPFLFFLFFGVFFEKIPPVLLISC